MTGLSASGARPVRVFISYARASVGHEKLVRELWLFLRGQGIDAKLDAPAAEHPQDWTLWILEQVREADYVLVVASAAYRRRAEGLTAPEESRGVPFEAALIREAIYADPATARRKYLPVLLADGHAQDIPAFLGPTSGTHYRVADVTGAGTEQLLRVLTGRPGAAEPGLGPAPSTRPADRWHAAAGRSSRPDGAAAGRLAAGDLGKLVDRLLAVSEVASPAQWQQVIDLMPAHLGQVIPRQSNGRGEAIALLRTCERYPHGWSALLEALRLVGPRSPAVQDFAEEVERLGLS
jgi:hypothetical protein